MKTSINTNVKLAEGIFSIYVNDLFCQQIPLIHTNFCTDFEIENAISYNKRYNVNEVKQIAIQLIQLLNDSNLRKQ